MHRRRRHHHQWSDDRGVSPEVERFIERMNGYIDDWGRESRYYRHVGEPGPGPNRHRLYRNLRDGRIAGVCAGLADYFGFRVKHVRIAAILAAIFATPVAVFGYVAGALFLRPGEPIAARYERPEEERFWRAYSARPRATMAEMRHRFRALDARIAEMERTVTSNEYSLNRAFRDLERGA